MGVTSTDGETVICGIIGVAGDLFAKDLRAFNSLLVLDVLRGRDSTGVLGYNKHLKNYDIIKDACDPITLMGYKRYDGIVTAQKQVLIGHNRSATRGKICRANAHPFDADGVCGVHNGTIPWEAVRELKAGRWARRTTFEPQPDGSVLRRIVRPDGTVEKEEILVGPRWEIMTARARSGLSQSEFAQSLGVSKRTLENWEQGRSEPTGAARRPPRKQEGHGDDEQGLDTDPSAGIAHEHANTPAPGFIRG